MGITGEKNTEAAAGAAGRTKQEVSMVQGETKYVYVLVRKDLSLSQQTVQSCHAAIEAARRFITTEQVHPHLVLCGVKDEEALKKEVCRLEAFGIEFACFYEPDRSNELTAIATAPVVGEQHRLCERYKLLIQGIEVRGPP